MNKKSLLAVAAVLILSRLTHAQDWHMQPLQIQTRWAASVSPSNALPEYPRPQMVRQQWRNLNGLWEYAITADNAPAPQKYVGHILVPYPVESALSGVQRPLRPNQLLWYRRTLDMKPESDGRRTLLHFGAVDFRATVYLNGHEVGSHAGGYQHFTLDVTEFLRPGANELVVKVADPTDYGPNPHGKQTLQPQGIDYTASSGIWQTVWLESVPRTYIRDLKLTPDVDHGQLHVEVKLDGQRQGFTVAAFAKVGTTVVAQQVLNGVDTLRIEQPHLWSADDPFLYDLEIRLLQDGKVVDQVQSYFGLRKVEVKKDEVGA